MGPPLVRCDPCEIGFFTTLCLLAFLDDKEAAEASSKRLMKQVVEGEDTIEELERSLKKSKGARVLCFFF